MLGSVTKPAVDKLGGFVFANFATATALDEGTLEPIVAADSEVNTIMLP